MLSYLLASSHPPASDSQVLAPQVYPLHQAVTDWLLKPNRQKVPRSCHFTSFTPMWSQNQQRHASQLEILTLRPHMDLPYRKRHFNKTPVRAGHGRHICGPRFSRPRQEYHKFQATLGYRVRPCLKNKNKINPRTRGLAQAPVQVQTLVPPKNKNK
jgi:hypothetical protein